jgi:hypothetical protein
VSLANARGIIGFSGFKPAVPFLLGSLLETGTEHQSGIGEVQTFGSSGIAEGVGVPFGSGADGIFGREQAGVETARQSPGIGDADGPGEDFSLLDLSDEEIELLIDEDALERGNMEAPGEEAHEIIPGESAEVNNLQPADDHLSALEIEIPAVDLPLQEVQLEEPAASKPAFGAGNRDEAVEIVMEAAPASVEVAPAISELIGNATDLGVFDSSGPPNSKITENSLSDTPWSDGLLTLEMGTELKAEKPARPPEDPTNDFEIDFSESDLDSLLEELGSSPKGAA